MNKLTKAHSYIKHTRANVINIKHLNIKYSTKATVIFNQTIISNNNSHRTAMFFSIIPIIPSSPLRHHNHKYKIDYHTRKCRKHSKKGITNSHYSSIKSKIFCQTRTYSGYHTVIRTCKFSIIHNH